ncbi:MAG: SUMF1/EgtB/PvdO family nonheme iron enzyme [Bacteroidetes bacterium]|nr:SUMF1/EgtB/PvdO family nonheme iron enzyme [Bacteroidota bacterium]MBS1931603.1 SUMF1/EgtB/PvdO family nonheme iron enzyme [Bacteroidota bacterium]
MLLSVTKTFFAQDTSSFVQVPKGEYFVGKKGHLLNPYRKADIESYFISKTEITNLQFEKFINATGYKTDAERMHNAMIFVPGLKEFEWEQDSTAYWRYPNGKSRGGIENKMNHPVTAISYTDAIAYCKWAGVRLPTLDEWEIACRAGSTTDYFWGNDRSQIKKYANIWYGRNHLTADSTDGYMYTSPVASFAPNPWGLYDVYGNVFEFCEGELYGKPKNKNIAHARGGSWWCSKNACNFFNSFDIGRVNIHASFSNQGFRVAKSY